MLHTYNLRSLNTAAAVAAGGGEMAANGGEKKNERRKNMFLINLSSLFILQYKILPFK